MNIFRHIFLFVCSFDLVLIISLNEVKWVWIRKNLFDNLLCDHICWNLSWKIASSYCILFGDGVSYLSKGLFDGFETLKSNTCLSLIFGNVGNVARRGRHIGWLPVSVVFTLLRDGLTLTWHRQHGLLFMSDLRAIPSCHFTAGLGEFDLSGKQVFSAFGKCNDFLLLIWRFHRTMIWTS